jgi:4-hydroxy-2-oxoheptanedioate aldolase
MNTTLWKQTLSQKPQLGLCMMYPAAGILENIGCDWDWIWIDGQHGELDYRDQLDMVRVCNLIQRPAVIRVPGHDSGMISLALDLNPDGLMVPMVENADQARRIVKAACFAPRGSRSFGGRRPIDRLGRGYCQDEKFRPLLILQIENQSGLKNAEEIIALDGVDALLFGADDFTLEAGLPMDKPKPKGFLDEPLTIVAQAARKHNKIAGAVFVAPDILRQGIELGYRLIVAGSDVGLLKSTSQNVTQTLRNSLNA